jgi:hypothetical protein
VNDFNRFTTISGEIHLVTHAFLITAYRDWPALESLLKQLLEIEGSRIYVNVDARRTALRNLALDFERSRASGRVFFKTDAIVRWAGFRHLDVLMELADQAATDGADRFHTMTGQCRLTVAGTDFVEFFETNADKNYLEHFALPQAGWNMDGGLDRLRYYHLHDVLDLKTGFLARAFSMAFLQLQKLFQIDRLRSISYFGGSGYYSLNRLAMNYFLTEYRKTQKRYQHTYCSEEVAPQTILCNAPPEIEETLENDNLRFVLWEEKHGEIPGLLDEADFGAVRQSGSLFARKFDTRFSSGLTRMFP